MVNSYYTWKDFALIPENKVNRLVMQLDSFALQQHYDTPSSGIIHHGNAVDLAASLGGTQVVVYSGRKGLGAVDGSGHPLLLGMPPTASERVETIEDTVGLFGAGEVRANGDPEALVATAPVKVLEETVASVADEAHRGHTVAVRVGGDMAAREAVNMSARAAHIERPVSRYKRHYQNSGDAGEKQLGELEADEWGQRSIATARKWIVELCKQLDTATHLATKYSYIMDDPRPGSPHTNLQLMQQALLRLISRLVKPHRTMLHGLRPWAFRSSAVLSSQALVNSRDFPPNFPGSPSDRRLYSSRFLHIWAWLVALNNPPAYAAISDLQKKFADTAQVLAGVLLVCCWCVAGVLLRVEVNAQVLRLSQDERLLYLCSPVFQPQPEQQRLGTRLHIQALNLPLPPSFAASADAYYTKALCKVDGEPSTEVGMRERAKGGGRIEPGASIADAFDGSMLLDG